MESWKLLHLELLYGKTSHGAMIRQGVVNALRDQGSFSFIIPAMVAHMLSLSCLLYTSDAADDM
eukprot:3845772-Prorocentrum_lima.AAC.1